MRFYSFCLVIIFLIMAGCSVSQADAEATALAFVKERAKFYVTDEGNVSIVPKYQYWVSSVVDNGDFWLITVNIQTQTDDGAKSAYVKVEIEKRSGKVTKFNNASI